MALQKTRPINLEQHDIERFWGFVEIGQPNECWYFRGFKDKYGYGRFSVKWKPFFAHRVALTIKLGREIKDYQQSCHTCDHPACCNPAHLWEGTRKQNSEDCVAKGRARTADRTGYKYSDTAKLGFRRGESSPMSKLNTEKVIQIYLRCLQGTESNTSISKDYGVDRKSIDAIANGKSWKHVTSQIPTFPCP